MMSNDADDVFVSHPITSCRLYSLFDVSSKFATNRRSAHISL